jgi:hypothetical protein
MRLVRRLAGGRVPEPCLVRMALIYQRLSEGHAAGVCAADRGSI